jgi:hypothetical protein
VTLKGADEKIIVLHVADWLQENLVDKKSNNPAQNAKFGSLGRFSNFNVSMRYSD